MKINTLNSSASALVLAAGLFAATFQASAQSILIKVYDFSPTDVRFVATISNANANATVSIANGIDLLGFFTNSPGIVNGAATGHLIPSGTGGVAFNAWETDNLLALGQYKNLNLFNNSVSATEVFNTSTAAFVNNQMGVIDLSSYASRLPAVGTSGNIYSGDTGSPGNNWLIGKWIVVVPEPSVEAQLALGAMVLAGLAFVRRTRRASASR